ncbi:MAG: hypothetical protein R3307_06100, partial [Anaerolineales bacterium]|nr:hypothetical protein [Anaerolineales bacterium]
MNWRIILRNGFLGGGIAFYLSAIGLTETFAERYLIGTFLSMGQLFAAIGGIAAGLLTARALKEEKTSTAYTSSLLSGAVSSILPLFLIFLIQILVVPQVGRDVIFTWRDMFVNFSPTLVEILTFGQSLILGSILLIIVSSALAGIGAALVLLPPRPRIALLNALIWVLGMGIFSENVTQILNQLRLRFLIRFLFLQKTLNPTAAILIFIVAYAVAYFRVHTIVQKRWGGMSSTQRQQGTRVGLVLGILLLILLPWMVGQFLSQAFFLIGLFVMMGLGLNIVVGYAGLLDLGYVAFYALGAYTMGILTSTGPLGQGELSFWVALPIAAVVGVFTGLILGFPV